VTKRRRRRRRRRRKIWAGYLARMCERRDVCMVLVWKTDDNTSKTSTQIEG
jgi:hypothetical protein